MTNDKELIERLALESSKGIHIPGSPDRATYFVPGGLAIQLCTRFIAAYLAERGKEAFAFYDEEFGFNFPGFWNNPEEAIKAGELVPVFLSPPAIPEGMALVPIEPTHGMICAAADCREVDLDYGYESELIEVYRSMITAAGVQP